MTEEEYYRKRDEYISRFINGDKCYQTSQLFHNMIEMLVRGKDPYEMIFDLIEINERTLDAFEQYVRTHP